MYVWGRIESILVIIDFYNLDLMDVPLGALVSLAYPIFRMSMGYGMYAHVINASWILNVVFFVARGMFDDVSAETIFLATTDDTFQALLGYLRVDQI